MRNIQFLTRVAPCVAILTIGAVASFALPTASYADTTAACKAEPGSMAANVPMGANGKCPSHFVPVEAENPQAIAPGGAAPVDGAPAPGDAAPGSMPNSANPGGAVGRGANGEGK
jgi:hypothetical protein